MELVNLPV